MIDKPDDDIEPSRVRETIFAGTATRVPYTPEQQAHYDRLTFRSAARWWLTRPE